MAIQPIPTGARVLALGLLAVLAAGLLIHGAGGSGGAEVGARNGGRLVDQEPRPRDGVAPAQRRASSPGSHGG